MADPEVSGAPACEMDGCGRTPTRTVRYCGGLLTTEVCDIHARYVRMIEAEWDEAEREFLEQP